MHSAEQEEQCGVDEKEECNACREEAGDRIVNIEVIELCCRDGIDRTGRYREDEYRT